MISVRHFHADREPAPNRLLHHPTLHQALRVATAAVHQRLHGHAGFAAVQDGSILPSQYRQLLMRLYGFHVAFETATGAAPERSGWLAEDLARMGADGGMVDAAPRCADMPALDTPARLLGALYVVEGSTLGGRIMAPRLDGILGRQAAGRRFLLGRGTATGGAWRLLLGRIEAIGHDPHQRAEAVAAAMQTFAAFEDWLCGWRDFSHD